MDIEGNDYGHGFNSSLLLDDATFARAMLSRGKLSGPDITFALRNLLKMQYYPVGLKFFFSEAEIQGFKDTHDYRTPVKPVTFCHYLAAARQKGELLFGMPNTIGCSNALYVFGSKEMDEAEVEGHLKYSRDLGQAERFVKDKTRMPKRLLGFAAAPIHKASFSPDVAYGTCNVLQAYHLANDWMAATDSTSFEATMSVNSAACMGTTRAFLNDRPNLLPMCSGSYTSGKTGQDELNWIWPYAQLEATVFRMLERTVRDGGASFPRTGEPYPGSNVCKLCPLLVWKKEGREFR